MELKNNLGFTSGQKTVKLLSVAVVLKLRSSYSVLFQVSLNFTVRYPAQMNFNIAVDSE